MKIKKILIKVRVKNTQKEIFRHAQFLQNQVSFYMHLLELAQLIWAIGKCYSQIQTRVAVHFQVAIYQVQLVAQITIQLLLKAALILIYQSHLQEFFLFQILELLMFVANMF